MMPRSTPVAQKNRVEAKVLFLEAEFTRTLSTPRAIREIMLRDLLLSKLVPDEQRFEKSARLG